MATAGASVDVYATMLQCARAQADAIRQDDWNTYGTLAAERCELLAASEREWQGDQFADSEAAADLIRAVLAADAETEKALAAKRERLDQESRRFQEAVVAATAYRAGRRIASGLPSSAPQRLGHLLDARR